MVASVVPKHLRQTQQRQIRVKLGTAISPASRNWAIPGSVANSGIRSVGQTTSSRPQRWAASGR